MRLPYLTRLLLMLTVELACLSRESCLRPSPVLAQEKLPQTEKRTESAEDAVTHATGAALQANDASAVKILLGVPASAVGGEDAEWRACMIARFGPSAKPALLAIDDPWMAKLAQIYVAYWQHSLTQT